MLQVAIRTSVLLAKLFRSRHRYTATVDTSSQNPHSCLSARLPTVNKNFTDFGFCALHNSVRRWTAIAVNTKREAQPSVCSGRESRNRIATSSRRGSPARAWHVNIVWRKRCKWWRSTPLYCVIDCSHGAQWCLCLSPSSPFCTVPPTPGPPQHG